MSKPEKRPPIDWEAIERDYRAGLLSVVEIGRQQGVSHTAINKRAKAKGWARSLAPRIRAEVSARLVSAAVSVQDQVSAEKVETIIEHGASVQIGVVRSHQKRIGRALGLSDRFLEQLSEAMENREAIEELIEIETAGDRSPMRRAMMLKAVSLGGQVGILKDLASSMKVLVDLERQAFGINGETEPEKPAEAGLSEIELARRVAFMLAKAQHAIKQGGGS